MSQPHSTEEHVNVVEFAGRRVQLGALDLGSNSFHLVIAQESAGRIQIIDKHKEMVRLAAGLGPDNQLSKESTDKALDCLSRLAQRLRPLDTENIRIVGTNTLRLAKGNGFLQRAEKILGRRIDIISGHEEARLIYLGVCHDLGSSDSRRLIVDIGGGSTEIILGHRFEPKTLESLYMGCVSMTRRFFPQGKITHAAMSRAVNASMVELEPVMTAFASSGWDIAIGTSGTINSIQTTLKQIYNLDQISADHLAHLRKRVVAAKHLDKLEIPGLANERKAVFPGGLAILIAVFQALKVDTMITSEGALREGLIFDLVGRQHQDDIRDHSVNSLMERFSVDRVQARQVREMSISLLSQVATKWELTNAECKQVISWASDLHEIGMTLSHAGYHKHGAYMIENMDLPGFSRRDQQQLAGLVRAHRRKLSMDLFPEGDLTSIRLAALLRLSAVLHRNRSSESLPHFEATAKGRHLGIAIPKKWLKLHPLTKLDLKQECDYLEAIGLTLEVELI